MSLLFLLCVLLIPTAASGHLRPGFYSETCPRAESIVREVMKKAMSKEPRSGASVMRLQFHDCFVNVILGTGTSIFPCSNRSNLCFWFWFLLIFSGLWWFCFTWWYTKHARGKAGFIEYKFVEILRSYRSSEGGLGDGMSRDGFLCRCHNHGL